MAGREPVPFSPFTEFFGSIRPPGRLSGPNPFAANASSAMKWISCSVPRTWPALGAEIGCAVLQRQSCGDRGAA